MGLRNFLRGLKIKKMKPVAVVLFKWQMQTVFNSVVFNFSCVGEANIYLIIRNLSKVGKIPVLVVTIVFFS